MPVGTSIAISAAVLVGLTLISVITSSSSVGSLPRRSSDSSRRRWISRARKSPDGAGGEAPRRTMTDMYGVYESGLEAEAQAREREQQEVETRQEREERGWDSE